MAENSVYDSIKPIFYASQPFAFNLHTLHAKSRTLKHISIPNVLYNLAFLIVYFYAYVHGTMFTNYGMGPGHALMTTVNNFETQFEFALSLFIITASWCTAGVYFKFLNGIDKIDKMLEKINVKTPSTKWMSYAISGSSLGLMFLVIAIRLYIKSNESFDGNMVSYMIMFHVPKLIGFIGLDHFINLLAILKSRYKTVNNYIATFNTAIVETPLNNSATNIYTTLKMQPLTVKRLSLKTTSKVSIYFENQPNAFTKSHSEVQPTTPKLYHANPSYPTSPKITMRTLKHVHDTLCDRATELNDLFSVTTLLLMTATFVRSTSELNNCARTIIDIMETGFKPMHGSFLYVNLSMVSLTVWHLVVMAAVCTFTNGEANYTPVLVHKLMTRTNDNRMTKELETFSMQLLHRKVQFTACGFFPLDATILFGVVGGVTTYLVILIQFQLAKV